MALVFDPKTTTDRTVMFYDKTRDNRLWCQWIACGVGANIVNPGAAPNPAFAKLQVGFCRLFDGKWTRSFANANNWVDHWVPIQTEPVVWQDVEGTTQNGAAAPGQEGLAYFEFNWTNLGITYEMAKHGFVFTVMDTGGVIPGQRIQTYQYIDVYQAWQEQRSNHNVGGAYGVGVPLMDNAITAAKFDVGAIEADAFANNAITHNVIADDTLRESKFGDNSISARVIATDAIDADAIAEAAIGAIEFGDLASAEIADHVWNRLASTYESNSSDGNTMGERIAALSRSVLRWDNPALTTQADARVNIVANAANAAGRFFGVDVPNDINDNSSWAGSKATLWSAATGKTTACSIVALLNDGANNYFQLRLNQTGATNITIAANDRLYYTSLAGLSISDVFDEPLYPNHVSPGTLGDSMLRMLGLRQHNMQIAYSAWNAAGTPTAGTIYLYASKADLEADPNITGNNATGKYEFNGTFDANTLKPLTYKSAIDPNV